MDILISCGVSEAFAIGLILTCVEGIVEEFEKSQDNFGREFWFWKLLVS